jgi:hypothetical protein
MKQVFADEKFTKRSHGLCAEFLPESSDNCVRANGQTLLHKKDFA